MSLEKNQTHQIDAIAGCLSLSPASIALVILDMPYGLTECWWDTRPNLAAVWGAIEHCLTPSGCVLATSIQPFTTDLIVSKRDWFRESAVLNKVRCTGFLNAKKRRLRIHEDITVFSPSGDYTYNPVMWQSGVPKISKTKHGLTDVYGSYESVPYESDGIRYPTSIMTYSLSVLERETDKRPTKKPAEFFAELIATYSNPGDLVLDPFMGSGATARACRMLGRDFIGFDIDPEAVRMANEGMHPLTIPLWTNVTEERF